MAAFVALSMLGQPQAAARPSDSAEERLARVATDERRRGGNPQSGAVGSEVSRLVPHLLGLVDLNAELPARFHLGIFLPPRRIALSLAHSP